MNDPVQSSILNTSTPAQQAPLSTVSGQLPPAVTPPSSTHQRSSIFYLIPLILFIIGIIAGYIYAKLFPGTISVQPTESQIKTTRSSDISIPREAVLIQECSDHRGALYVRPQDIPVGPIYMVHNGKVIGIEYMLAQDEFLAGESYKYLSALNISIDHVNTGLFSKGHAGYPTPHYHIDLYSVSREIEDSITCPGSASPMQGMPEMHQDINLTPESSPSAMPTM